MFLKVINLCRIMPEVLEPRAWLEPGERIVLPKLQVESRFIKVLEVD
jgi:hypothetical protein